MGSEAAKSNPGINLRATKNTKNDFNHFTDELLAKIENKL